MSVFAERRSVFFKHMQIVRGCDAKRNVLVYMVYTDKLIDGLAEEFDVDGPGPGVGHDRRGAALRRFLQRLIEEAST